MVVILQWLTAEWPGRSAFTGVQTVVIAPPTSKWEIAALSMFTTLVVHRAVTTATAAVTNCFPRSLDELQVLKKIHFLRNNPCVKYQHVCTIEKVGFYPDLGWSWLLLLSLRLKPLLLVHLHLTATHNGTPTGCYLRYCDNDWRLSSYIMTSSFRG